MMTHVRHEYHIKVKKSGGAFKVIPVILMHYRKNEELDEFLKVQQIKNSEELLKRNEEIVLPLFCMTWSYE